MYQTTIIIFSLFLILILVSTYFINKKRVEGFKDMYFGILPKENHTVRVGKLLYYNDPIFIQYGSKYVMLKPGKSLGTIRDSIGIINYIKPKTVKKGLTPIAYNEPVFMKGYPDNDFNKNFNIEVKIVPYTRPENNQQPYIEMGDFIAFVTKNNEYLVVEEGSEELRFVNSSSIPNNGIFRLINSPQCYINYKMYGVDLRDGQLSTIKMVMDKSREYLEKEKKKIIGDDKELREMKQKEVDIKEEIQKLENSGEVLALELSNLKQQYELDLKKIKNSIEDRKLELKKDLEINKQLAENILDEKYLKEMKDILDRGCK